MPRAKSDVEKVANTFIPNASAYPRSFVCTPLPFDSVDDLKASALLMYWSEQNNFHQFQMAGLTIVAVMHNGNRVRLGTVDSPVEWGA